MERKPAVLIFFNDWPVYPDGANCGGGETATMALAEACRELGYRTIACAYLPHGDTTVRGVEYWNFGYDYNIASLLPRIREIGPYVAIAATLVNPLMVIGGESACQKKILINHSPGVNPSGLESRTVMHLVDWFVCVSHAQKEIVLSRGKVPTERIQVIRNGFDPKLFSYAGPEERDWNQLLYAGRLEFSKGIHCLLGAYTNLKRKFPELKLSVYGDQSCWPSLQEQIPHIQASTPGLLFHGKVPQTEIAAQLRRAGCLVFPSLSFESAGLSVLDAQASGCPVVASDVGGVREYLIPECGVLVEKLDAERLEAALFSLLSDRDRLINMSRQGEAKARSNTWERVARSILELVNLKTSPLLPPSEVRTEKKLESNPLRFIDVNESFYRTWFETGFQFEQILQDHEIIAFGEDVSDDELLNGEGEFQHSAFLLWQALRLDARGKKDEARQCLLKAEQLAEQPSWQTTFRLILLGAELGQYNDVKQRTERLLERYPNFPLRMDLERLMSQIGMTQEGIPPQYQGS